MSKQAFYFLGLIFLIVCSGILKLYGWGHIHILWVLISAVLSIVCFFIGYKLKGLE